ncbi:MAG TPA: radical SAM protein [Bacteroidota bacterium]
MNVPALANVLGTRCRTLPLVILYVTEGCNLHCVTCSYRKPLAGEMSLADIVQLGGALKRFGLRHIVFSGGEPLLRRDFPEICRVFSELGVKQSMLTNGVLLAKRMPEVGQYLDEIIVSIDGPTAEIHDPIRGTSFGQIIRGIRKAQEQTRRITLSVRTVIQKANFRTLAAMVRLAEALQVDHISFLAADILSDSFGRQRPGKASDEEHILLSGSEVEELRQLIGRMARDFSEEFNRGFIMEAPEKLLRVAQYYEALLAHAPFPTAPCNAPMVSAVITSTGDLKPCFFLPAFANVREGDIGALMDCQQSREVRGDVRAQVLHRCKTCVCRLHVNPAAALLNRF